MNFQSSYPTIPGTGKLKVLKSPATSSRLAYTSYVQIGRLPNTRVILIHGFTQNGATFGPIASELALRQPFEVICVDLPGHGESCSVDAGLDETADLLLPFGMDSIWAAYSLGARHLLTLCLKHSDFSWKAIFSGVNPGIEDAGERLERYQADMALASELKNLEGDHDRFKEFLSRWMSLALFQPRKPTREDLENRLTNSPRALARSLENSSVGVQANLWPRIPELRGYFTLITGGADTRYLGIARRFESLLKSHDKAVVRSEIIDSLGHGAIIDRPPALIQAVIDSSKV
ncbi:MAG: alpha/beta fold hydrolase [Actinomycetota bacterium]|nr:MAG: alpha/beta fold hydrolase [Actinomycetota bacterium]